MELKIRKNKDVFIIDVSGEMDLYNSYKLKENKPEKYRKMFEALKEILAEEELDEEKYVKNISFNFWISI